MPHVWRCFLSHRSGRRIRKTRKYDIITTPAERVEMAPLNEENDDEDDSTLFDVKYRFVLYTRLSQSSVFIFLSIFLHTENVLHVAERETLGV